MEGWSRSLHAREKQQSVAAWWWKQKKKNRRNKKGGLRRLWSVSPTTTPEPGATHRPSRNWCSAVTLQHSRRSSTDLPTWPGWNCFGPHPSLRCKRPSSLSHWTPWNPSCLRPTFKRTLIQGHRDFLTSHSKGQFTARTPVTRSHRPS